jgi:hypothetical protein
VASPSLKETDLYLPIKRMLEGQGYVVKGEIGAADVVAVRGDDEPVIIELKTGFSLSLFHQGIARQAITDAVYVAVPRGSGRAFLKALADNKSLCRRLGLGLITVRMEDSFVEVHCDPEPYKPRQSKVLKARLLREFGRRVGDPNNGGATRRGIVTSYRQDALKVLRLLNESGAMKASHVAAQAGVKSARQVMADDHYGWFERVRVGVYALTPRGAAAVGEYAGELEKMALAAEIGRSEIGEAA